MGLSPRVRGNLLRGEVKIITLGSIPACAGEPANEIFGRGNWGVYPRVCGGTTANMFMRIRSVGLSPRVRGNLERRPALSHVVGSIPACAGEPRPRWVRLRYRAVYPRVCGGTAIAITSLPVPLGLSPRVRGNLSRLSALRHVRRSIPACAGEPLVNVIEHALLYSYLEYY